MRFVTIYEDLPKTRANQPYGISKTGASRSIKRIVMIKCRLDGQQYYLSTVHLFITVHTKLRMLFTFC